ncbi:sugar phosphate isomerase/epimerase family protein [Pleomorphovibrio marinus]|uniref:sugar phosphate isomerase/epimerase family protein n=1 Tax=Pleomorphovibrio marinus TaxID=2164132 RepID=UPI000E0B93B8|nr:sugar phosphate isomerase/epimerase [Pleomorphovibrio marinus]
MKRLQRRKVLKQLGLLTLSPWLLSLGNSKGTKVYAHIWAYASRFPPNWDSTPVLEEIFKDLKAAGIAGVELMEVNFRHEDSVLRLRNLSARYGLPVIGTSYGAAMWDKSKHEEILVDAEMVLDKLAALQGKYFGISVGNAGREKTEDELDDQATLLKQLLGLCAERGITPNLHNHTYELEYGKKDFLGTIERVPNLPLGPDVNWLIRAGIDPVAFIGKYGPMIAYLHLRDQDAEGRWTEALGEGVTDFEGIAKALERVRFSGDVAIELAYEKPGDQDDRENFRKSREYVRKVFGW